MEKKKGFISEFKEFISRGNVVDLAVGVIIGSSFTAIVTSLVNDIIMPVIGILFGGLNFTELKYVITPAAGDVAEAAIYYGNFIQCVVNFLLISFVIFTVVKAINRFHKKVEKPQEEVPATDPEDIALLKEIRDLLKKDR
ncbi:MAG: large-conductance mechanosensitive channel protein MscL [Clostridiales bacterium]|nr:large-conductance mechanosensitive channel protein MscL [Clostridiales bacterium]